MNKTIILSGVAVLLAVAACAQTEEATIKKEEQSIARQEKVLKQEKRIERREMRKAKEKEIDFRAKEQFRLDFADVSSGTWRKEHNFDVVSFMKDGIFKTAYYDFNDKLVGTTEAKIFSDLPEKGREFINKNYKDYTVGDVILFDDNESNEMDMILFGHEFADSDNYFVELIKNNKKIVVKVDPAGEVGYFTQMR